MCYSQDTILSQRQCQYTARSRPGPGHRQGSILSINPVREKKEAESKCGLPSSSGGLHMQINVSLQGFGVCLLLCFIRPVKSCWPGMNTVLKTAGILKKSRPRIFQFSVILPNLHTTRIVFSPKNWEYLPELRQ